MPFSSRNPAFRHPEKWPSRYVMRVNPFRLNARPAIVGAVVAASTAVFTHALPFKLGLFCGALAGIVAATLTDLLQNREPPSVEAA